MLKARLHPHWVGGRDGYRYSVICDSRANSRPSLEEGHPGREEA